MSSFKPFPSTILSMLFHGVAAGIVLFSIAGCSETPSAVDFGQRIIDADKEPQNWLSYNRNYEETRDSPLSDVSDANVSRLGLVWSYDFDTERGQESSPIVVDGTMFTTSAWSKVQAFEAVSGKLLWQFDPQVPGSSAAKACCDVVNRGVAYWDGKVFVGTIDGRLIALDGKSGRMIWSTLTVDPESKNTITGAPRVVKGKVIIGNGGAEQGARGFVSAYDAQSGKLVWRFYTVPGEPGKKDGAASDAILAKLAQPTWAGKWWTKEAGMGGGTVWDSMSYDPKLDLLYIGVGNGSFWSRQIRTGGKGDNLFISSILALRPDTGEYVWHYQQTPGDEWDYTATQQMILTDLEISGRVRNVIMQAPKNGFFYVLDRATGELLSAEPYAQINWADGVDMKTGRPRIRPEARWSENGRPFVAIPSGSGAHNWNPMSYSKATGLVYIPAQDFTNAFVPDTNFKYMSTGFNAGIDPSSLKLPDDPSAIAKIRKMVKGHLLAWDPVKNKEVWRVSYDGVPNGGVLSTAGNLVFQGDSSGHFSAFNARTGKQLWTTDVQSPVMAAPITWAYGGKQYITVIVGWGGSLAMSLGEIFTDQKGRKRPTKGRVLTFALDGTHKLPPPDMVVETAPAPPTQFADATKIKIGDAAYHRTCFVCHGVNAYSATAIPDLRYSAALGDPEVWNSIVIDGVLSERGMVSFKDNFSSEESDAIRAYVISRSQRAAAARH